ncbi:MAG: hypothetical protein KKA16_02875 [Alphaproteobacteria bacterium]|nr:hypothetical protein [Alphaproteobacteria bacterium]MBU2378534.1 hypothetical protein [Alphaproteobacteria bacterium]
MPTYFCFIERDIYGTPHMEALMAETDADARSEAEALLRTHASGIAAHILLDAVRIATIRRIGLDLSESCGP